MKKISQIEGIVFDMDGILFDTERMAKQCWYQIAEELGLESPEKAVLGCIGLNRRDTKELLLGLYGNDFPFDLFRDLISKRMEETINREGIPVKPGAYELLDYLNTLEIKIGLASSTRTVSIYHHLEQAKMKDFFSVICGGDMVEKGKPEPDIYLMACEGLMIDPKKSIAIEDSPNGIVAAFLAGMQVIMVPDLVEPTLEIQARLWKQFDTLFAVKEFLKTKEIKY